jgi:NAD(P)-dependent dehydrogenase (short-subunit alcohol dehydrogenase family)
VITGAALGLGRECTRHLASTVGAGVDDPWDAYARQVSDALALRG